MTEPRDLTDLVPVDVRAEVNTAITVLETHSPAVIEALRQLDRAATAAWKAVSMAEATEDEWQLVERRLGIDHGWNVAYRLLRTLELPSMQSHRSRNG
jgi:hypothetical protein